MGGPLEGVRVVELAGLGPAPFCGMLLSDMGADVLRVDRPGTRTRRGDLELLNRGRRSIAVDLKQPAGRALVLRLVEEAEALIEGFRPGVAERLGVGPDQCLAANGRLIYGRMTGWGQDGPYAHTAGHDINYIALAGALFATGRRDSPPPPPLNLVGDFGGGGMLLSFGVVCGILEARRSGVGQVIDAAMVDGAALLTTMVHGVRAGGWWLDERESNFLDGGAHYYDSYETADGGYIAVGAVEPQFYDELLERIGLAGEDLPRQMDRAKWPEMHDRLAAVFRTRTRDEWCSILEGSDACFAPVLSLAEAPAHPHNVARGTFVEVAGVVQPAPAPRFSRTPGSIDSPPTDPEEDPSPTLRSWGLAEDEIVELHNSGALG